MMSVIQPQANQIGLKLPDRPTPRGDYAAVIVHNGIAYVAGQVSRLANEVITGPVDQPISPERIKLAARACVLRALSALTTLEELLTDPPSERFRDFLRHLHRRTHHFEN
jgi:enamine deaminase RidA (YjgF/YER057c/UK114 family)